jgi:transcriptional regulator with XRE-family HTH domain
MADSLGKRIRERRTALRLTQEQVAKRLNLVKQSVSHWEGDRFLPSAGELAPLAKLLETTTDYLLSGTNPGPGTGVGGSLIPHPTYAQLLEFARGNLKLDQVQRRWPSALLEPGLIALDAIDAAMAPRIPAGSTLTVRLQKEPQPGEIGVVVLRENGEVLLRRLGDKPGFWTPDNSDYGVGRTVSKTDNPITLGVLVAVHVVGSR